MHSCDVSQAGRPFEIVNEWTYLLFEEFFDQGDLERKENLPITTYSKQNQQLLLVKCVQPLN